MREGLTELAEQSRGRCCVPVSQMRERSLSQLKMLPRVTWELLADLPPGSFYGSSACRMRHSFTHSPNPHKHFCGPVLRALAVFPPWGDSHRDHR